MSGRVSALCDAVWRKGAAGGGFNNSIATILYNHVLHPPLPLVGVSSVMERGCRQN